MSILIIKSETEPSEEITFRISPVDAWRLINEFNGQYPNPRTDRFPSYEEFVNKWCRIK